MTFIILKNYYFRMIIKNLTKCNILKTFALKNNGKFADHNLEKLCPRSLALATTIPVLGLEKTRSLALASDFWESSVLALKVVSSTSPLSQSSFILESGFVLLE